MARHACGCLFLWVSRSLPCAHGSPEDLICRRGSSLLTAKQLLCELFGAACQLVCCVLCVKRTKRSHLECGRFPLSSSVPLHAIATVVCLLTCQERNREDRSPKSQCKWIDTVLQPWRKSNPRCCFNHLVVQAVDIRTSGCPVEQPLIVKS